jgi:cell wall-associated NlpC family hydrolase
MATKLTKKEILTLPLTEYFTIRDSLQSGDIVFCSGNYRFSKAIQYFTKSVWSHVGVIYKDENLKRVFILESETGIGVRLAPLSKYLKDYHGKNRPYKGNMVIGKVNPAPTIDQTKKGISFGLDQLTKPYDNWEIIRIMIRILFKITRRVNDKKYICSELVQEIYKKTGITFPYNNTIISPNDIWCDKRINFFHRLM